MPLALLESELRINTRRMFSNSLFSKKLNIWRCYHQITLPVSVISSFHDPWTDNCHDQKNMYASTVRNKCIYFFKTFRLVLIYFMWIVMWFVTRILGKRRFQFMYIEIFWKLYSGTVEYVFHFLQPDIPIVIERKVCKHTYIHNHYIVFNQKHSSLNLIITVFYKIQT